MNIRFVHVPKTGGISIVQSLKESIFMLGEKESESWEIIGTDGTYHSRASSPKYFKRPDLEKEDVQHKKLLDTSFSFSFIRNPWDRFVSSYCYLKEKKDEEYEKYIKPFKSFKDFAINGSIESLHFKPQTYWIDAPINFVGRFEKLQSHFDGLCKTLGLSTQKLKKMNSTTHKSYLDYYDAETIKAVEHKYKEDVKLLGYSLEGYTHPS